MDTAWIQVFVLTLSESVAAAGKAACQEQEFQLQFLDEAGCEVVLQQLIRLKDESANVIVSERKSGCTRTAIERPAFFHPAAVGVAPEGGKEPGNPRVNPKTPDTTLTRYEKRLAKLNSCAETNDAAPCWMGEVIIEGAAGRKVRSAASGFAQIVGRLSPPNFRKYFKKIIQVRGSF